MSEIIQEPTIGEHKFPYPDYRDLTVEMLGEMKNRESLEMIYGFTNRLYEIENNKE